MLGAIIGDIVGSIYEFDNIKTKDFPLFAEDSQFTDDTVCTIAVAECLLTGNDPVTCLRWWTHEFWELSYGHAFFDWMRADDPQPYNSWGNGAAMRVSPAALLATSLEQARTYAIRVTEVTHNHPEGIKGACATTDAIWLALAGTSAAAIRSQITEWYGYDLDRTVEQIRPDYIFDESCQGTVPEAIICALEARDFEDAIRNAISIGGDSDTLAAITGAIAEGLFGIPDTLKHQVMARLPDSMQDVLKRMYTVEKKGG